MAQIISYPYKFTPEQCLAQLIEMRRSHELSYEHHDTLGEDERAEYNSQMVSQMDYLIELVQKDIADTNQIEEEGIES